MKRYTIAGMIAIMLTLTGCEAIGDIFSAGVYSGIFISVVVVVIIITLFLKLGRRK